MSSFLKENKGGNGVLISIRVQPGSRKSEIVGPLGDSLKIKIAAPPVEGAANEALREFLAEKLGVSKSKIQLLKGQSSRQKLWEVLGLKLQDVAKLLENK